MNNRTTGSRERRIEKAREALRNKFSSDPSYFQVDALEPDGITETVKEIKVINADYATHLNPARINSRYFVAHPDSLVKAGTVLFDLYDSDWLVTSSANLTEIVDRGMIQRVNYIAKWMKDGSEVENFSLITGVSRRSDGIEENFYMTIPNDSIMLHFPKNELTDTIKRDMRFMVRGMPYKINRIDGYTDPNLYFMIATEDQLNYRDNIEKGICDYEESTDPVTDLIITGTEHIHVGMEYTYKVENIPGGQTLVSFQISSGEEYIDTSSVSLGNKTLKLWLKPDSKIGEFITLIAHTSTFASVEKTLRIVSML